MKIKGFVVWGILLLCFAGLAVYITILSGNLYGDKDSTHFSYHSDKDITDYITYRVEIGDFVISEQLEGCVVYDEDAITEYLINKGDAAGIKVIPGQLVKANEALYYKNGKSVPTKSDGRVIDIDIDSDIAIKVLDYTKSAVVAVVTEKRQNYLDESAKIYGSVNGGNKELLQLKSINPNIADGGFEIRISNSFSMYGNSKIDICIEYGVKEKTVFVPNEYIKKTDRGNAYVTMLDLNGDEVKVFVQTGEESNGKTELIDAETIVGKEIVIDVREAVIDGNR